MDIWGRGKGKLNDPNRAGAFEVRGRKGNELLSKQKNKIFISCREKSTIANFQKFRMCNGSKQMCDNKTATEFVRLKLVRTAQPGKKYILGCWTYSPIAFCAQKVGCFSSTKLVYIRQGLKKRLLNDVPNNFLNGNFFDLHAHES